MSEPFIGEIRMFGGTYAPRNWAFCNGQMLPISDNQALFAIIGVTYGGDGRNTFALPDLRGRVPMHYGDDPGLTPYTMGQQGGLEKVTLTLNELPSQSHAGNIKASSGSATTADPANAVLANTGGSDANKWYRPKPVGARD